MKRIITVTRSGEIRFIYDDRLRGLLHHGQATIARASHVEIGDPRNGQDPLKWYANMVDGRVLGPHGARQAALDAEVEWINKNVLTASSPNPPTPE